MADGDAGNAAADGWQGFAPAPSPGGSEPRSKTLVSVDRLAHVGNGGPSGVVSAHAVHPGARGCCG